ncbi:hypothetical protein AB0J85_24130 [Micromonospora echinofusca]|uniref:hypothetical protein n=1 Tax=Micromonospora echinofusca TaxID=47858 RepID=UPI000C70F1E6|nr:hypothetical protein [Micromonospora sp. MSM11]MCL7458306.1 hypothetical protein [Micromonospora sp. MSM11]
MLAISWPAERRAPGWALPSYDYTRPGVIERGELLKFFEAVGYQARIRKLTTISGTRVRS